MKSLLLVVGTLAALVAPAVAGTKKKQPPAAKPIAVVVQASSVSPAAEQPALAEPAVEQLDIPALPADTASPLEQLVVAKPMLASAKPMKPSKAKPVVMNTGKDYVLGRRQPAKPTTDVEQIIPRSLTQAQVATVVQSRMADIQNCWDLVPKAQRADACTAELKLSISDAGEVTDIELGGDVPAGAHKCMTSAIAKWAFPVAETKSEIEYGISLRSL